MKRIVLIFGLLLFVNSVFCQEAKKKYWKFSGNTSLNLTQTKFNNWSAGGENSIAGITSGNFKLNFDKGKVAWVNNVNLAYGLTYQGSKKTKNQDRIYFDSKFGYKAFGKVDYSALTTFSSQFDKGYARYPIEEGALFNSKFMSPATTSISVGFDYKPNSNFSFYISPISGQFRFVLNDSLSNLGAHGVRPGKRVEHGLGASFNSTFSKTIKDNLRISSRLYLFSNLLRDPENVYTEWTLDASFKINKFITSNINMHYKYDNNVKHIDGEGRGPSSQFKQTLGIGFSYFF